MKSENKKRKVVGVVRTLISYALFLSFFFSFDYYFIIFLGLIA